MSVIRTTQHVRRVETLFGHIIQHTRKHLSSESTNKLARSLDCLNLDLDLDLDQVRLSSTSTKDKATGTGHTRTSLSASRTRPVKDVQTPTSIAATSSHGSRPAAARDSTDQQPSFLRASPRSRFIGSREYSQCQAMDGQSTAGIIVIGDEILKGQTLDTNSNFICKKLFHLGVKVQKISVICDEIDSIAQEVTAFSKKYTHVITSGGIGPTHDDMTFEGVARAFGLKTEHHPQLVQLISDWFHTSDLGSPEMKMAKVPQTAKLIFGTDPKTKKQAKYPLVTVNNVYIFPGVPGLLEKSFIMLGHLFQNPNVKFHTAELYVNKDETSIAGYISQVAEKFNRDVVIGSYPDITNSYYKVKLTLESVNANSLYEAQQQLYNSLPSDSVVQYDQDPMSSAVSSVYNMVEDPDESDIFIENVRHAVLTLEKTLDQYSPSDICISFNGGKDCTVLLHLLYAVAKKKYPNSEEKLKALYIRSRYPFPEVEKFVQISRDRYNLEMINYDGRIKDSLATLAEKQPNIKAVVMGTRRTDPFSGHLKDFSMTDADWPQFMRVNPMLEWHYKHVWKFLRQMCLPYCSLYDRGYTSLGSMDNTHPNPLLQYIDHRGILTYKPAYMLDNGEHERDGRNK